MYKKKIMLIKKTIVFIFLDVNIVHLLLNMQQYKIIKKYTRLLTEILKLRCIGVNK